MIIYPKKKLPDYYPTMYLDGYTPEEIRMALHNKMIKEYAERQAHQELEQEDKKKLEKALEQALDEILKDLK